MAEDIQQTGNRVTMAEYMASMPWRAVVDDLTEALERSGDEHDAEDERTPSRFILRLLDPDLAGASDRLVEVVAKDDLGPSSEQRAQFMVSVRPLNQDATGLGKPESHVMKDDSLIYGEGSTDDKGYFMGADWADEDDFGGAVARVRLPQAEPVALRSMELPRPEQYN